MRAFFRFLLFSNLFIAGCALAMTLQTSLLLEHRWTGSTLLLFIFFSTICSYSFHWWLTPVTNQQAMRGAWLGRYRAVHGFFFVAGLAGALITAIALRPYWGWLFLIAFITFLYSAPKIPHPLFRWLRKIALGKTFFLTVAWVFVTTVLPLIAGSSGFTVQSLVFITGRFFLLYAICILFDLRDREYDRRDGVRSLATMFPAWLIRRLFFSAILLYAVCCLALGFTGMSWMQVIIALIPGLLTGLAYRRAQKDHSDLFYYLVLDGLMALAPVLSLLLSQVLSLMPAGALGG